MERPVTASSVVDIPIVRARELLLGDPIGIVAGDPKSSDIWSTMALDVGRPRSEGVDVVLPVSCRGVDFGGRLAQLDAVLALRDHHLGALLDLQGRYRWAVPDATFGDGMLAHRFARWLAGDLVRSVGAHLLERSASW